MWHVLWNLTSFRSYHTIIQRELCEIIFIDEESEPSKRGMWFFSKFIELLGAEPKLEYNFSNFCYFPSLFDLWRSFPILILLYSSLLNTGEICYLYWFYRYKSYIYSWMTNAGWLSVLWGGVFSIWFSGRCLYLFLRALENLTLLVPVYWILFHLLLSSSCMN